MLTQRLATIFFAARTFTQKNQVVPKSAPEVTATQGKKDKYWRLHTKGPELQVTKILMRHGPLTSREIYRSYKLSIEEKRKERQEYEHYFNSLTHLKKTIQYMRTNGKISSNGYDKRKRLFKGWKLNQKRSLKYVHPTVIEEIQSFLKSKNEL